MDESVFRRTQRWLIRIAAVLLCTVCVASGEFRFTLAGDPRSDLARWNWTLDQMATKVGDEGAFHITAGDYYEAGAVTVAADFYASLKDRFGNDVQWYPTVGNHELNEGGPDMVWLRDFYDTHLEDAVNPGPRNGLETSYSWDYENAHFVQLNMYYDGTTDANGISQFSDALYDWLVEDLDLNTKPVVFVIYHEPAYPDDRGSKESPEGWERFWKLLNDRGVVAGLCAHSHVYARYQVDGDWDTFTWELDAGNAGRMSSDDTFQTFIDIAVEANGLVHFDTWRGELNEGFTLSDSWSAVAPAVSLIGPADGAMVDSNGAVLSCEPIADAISYKLLFGPDPQRMVYLASETSEPPLEIVSTFPFSQTWWTITVRTSKERNVRGVPILVNAENVAPQLIENTSTGTRYDCIQDAIDDSQEEEEIIVGPGAWQYFGGIDLKEEEVTLRSTDPADPAVVAATIINGDGRTAGVFFDYDNEECSLAGFTITNGTYGLYCEDASPNISGCVITANRHAGIYLSDSGAVVSDCTVTDNQGVGIKSVGDEDSTIFNCVITGNQQAGVEMEHSSLISNCLIAGNRHHGVLGDYASITNCTVAGNALSGVSGDSTEIVNSVFWNNWPDQIVDDLGTCSVGYSNIQTDWPGDGNIDADPRFISPGYWVDANDPNALLYPGDPNSVWIDGDYNLQASSPCIDAGDNAAVVPDIADLDGDSNTSEPTPKDLDDNVRFVDYPGVSDTGSGTAPIVDMGAYEKLLAPVEAEMNFTSQALNPCSIGNWVKAHFVLPAGLSLEDVNAEVPVEVTSLGIESQYINVILNEDGLVEIEAAFSRVQFCSTGAFDGTVTAKGWLASGQSFTGSDTIRITSNDFRFLVVFASNWLAQGCGAPDWCGESDIDRDTKVDFHDFAVLDGCCIEVEPN